MISGSVCYESWFVDMYFAENALDSFQKHSYERDFLFSQPWPQNLETFQLCFIYFAYDYILLTQSIKVTRSNFRRPPIQAFHFRIDGKLECNRVLLC